jgi:hypothetical protein
MIAFSLVSAYHKLSFVCADADEASSVFCRVSLSTFMLDQFVLVCQTFRKEVDLSFVSSIAPHSLAALP